MPWGVKLSFGHCWDFKRLYVRSLNHRHSIPLTTSRSKRGKAKKLFFLEPPLFTSVLQSAPVNLSIRFDRVITLKKLSPVLFILFPRVASRSPALKIMNWREAVFAVIAALSVIFNLLFCVFLLRRPSVLKKPHNVLLFSLSATDLVTGSCVFSWNHLDLVNRVSRPLQNVHVLRIRLERFIP